MHSSVLLLIALPSIWARPMEPEAKSRRDECVLPHHFTVKDFGAQVDNTKGMNLSAFDFEFIDDEIKIKTLCHFNSTSVSTTPEGLEPRYKCENGEVKFIWENDYSNIWMIERVCEGYNGAPQFEASGSAYMPLTCFQGRCRTNATEHKSTFTSLQPVRDPTR